MELSRETFERIRDSIVSGAIVGAAIIGTQIYSQQASAERSIKPAHQREQLDLDMKSLNKTVADACRPK